jgi:hypothetical protein
MRIGVIVAAVAALALGAAGAGVAQPSLPTIPITASDTVLRVGVTGPLAAGPTRFEVVRAGGQDLEITIAALRPGFTVAQLTAALRSGDPEAALEMVHLDGGTSLLAGDQRRAVTINLRPSSTYVVLNSSGESPSAWESAGFTVGGQSNGATAPKADARVRIVDLRFRGARAFPREGVVRFENAGWAPHFAVAAPLRRGARPRAVGRALRHNAERRLDRMVDFGSAIQPQTLITRGAVDYQEVRFPRRGRYVMACFFENHHTQGMYRFIRVR